MTQMRSALLATLTVVLSLAAPAASRAQGMPSDSVLRGFQPSGEYMLVVNGKPVPAAEIYQNDKVPAILILSSALPSPVMLTPRAGNVETVNLMKVSKTEGRHRSTSSPTPCWRRSARSPWRGRTSPSPPRARA